MNSTHTRGRRLRRALPALLLSLAMLATACAGDGDTATDDATTDDTTTEGETSDDGASDDGEAASGEFSADIALAMLPKQVNNPYFTTADGGGQEAAAEMGVGYELTGPSDANASSQVSFINTLTQQDKSGIMLSANDPNAVCTAVNQAMDAGVVVVTFDSDAPDCRDVFVNQATAEGIAEVQLQMVVDQLEGGEGQVAILSATPNATNQNAWIEMMETMIAEDDAYSGLEIVDVVYGNDEDQKSFQETQALLQTYPDLDAIISPTTVGIAAAARYVSSSDFKGEVIVTGLGTPNQMRDFVEDGTVGQFALWNPADLGYLATYVAGHLAAGNITGEPGETFEAGRLGEYEIGEDSVVLLGPPTVFDESNIGDFDF